MKIFAIAPWLRLMALAGAAAASLQVGAEVTSRDLGGHYGTQPPAIPVPVPIPVPDPFNRGQRPGEALTTSGNSCTCQVADTSGGACMIFLRTGSAEWIARNAPQTVMRSSASGRYYAAPFALAASACAGRKVAPAAVKVHWLDRGNAILEWK